METLRSILETIIQWLLTPATLIGGAGGLLSGISRHEKAWSCIFKAISGAIVANVVYPVIEQYAPHAWHYTLFFLSGIGGLKMVDSFYDWIFTEGILKDIIRKLLQKGTEK